MSSVFYEQLTQINNIVVATDMCVHHEHKIGNIFHNLDIIIKTAVPESHN